MAETKEVSKEHGGERDLRQGSKWQNANQTWCVWGGGKERFYFGIIYVYMSLSANTWVWYPWRPEESVGSPRAVTGSYEVLSVGPGNWTRVFGEEQNVLLISEPSLWHPIPTKGYLSEEWRGRSELLESQAPKLSLLSFFPFLFFHCPSSLSLSSPLCLSLPPYFSHFFPTSLYCYTEPSFFYYRDGHSPHIRKSVKDISWRM